MLQSLLIKNYALIERTELSFSDGFSVLTGETGAGKSIIIGALNLVTGGRASKDLIRTGAQKLSVEATFDIADDQKIREYLLSQDLDADESELTLYRDLTQSGKNTCRINGEPVSINVLRSVGDLLVDFHGQNEHQSILNAGVQQELLDAYAGETALSFASDVRRLYGEYSSLRKELNNEQTDASQRERTIDLYSYQLREIEAADPDETEEDTLTARRKVLQNAQSIYDGLRAAYAALSDESGALGPLYSAMQSMHQLAEYAEDYKNVSEALTDQYYAAEDCASTIERLIDGFSFDEEELDSIEQRLEILRTLKRKYGSSITAVLEYRDRIKGELDRLINFETNLEQNKKKMAAALSQYRSAARSLSSLRQKAAKDLEDALTKELSALGMPGGVFHIECSFCPDGEASVVGDDRIAYYFSGNAGELPKPLQKVASGGEISRVMLAFKSVFSEVDPIGTMVFDEIDSGISGQIGNAVGEKIALLGKKHQVICITHLPQIAACAAHHYHIRKEVTEGQTVSTAALLGEKERETELARIMGSTADDLAAAEHARSLLNSKEYLRR